jgi:predicted DNA-binding transcriptional regulator YafY
VKKQTKSKGDFILFFYYNGGMAKKLTYSRYIWFIDRAKKGRHPNAKRLVEYFEISLAQAQHDIDYMRDALGAPLEYIAAEKGYELSDRAFSLPSVWVEDDELLLLAIAKELIRDPDSKKILAALLRKIAINSRSGLGKAGRAVSYKSMGSYYQKAGILNPLLDAILNQRPTEILHREIFGPARETSWRKVTPLHLLFYRANWYLLAIYGSEWRTFSLARIEAVKVLPGKAAKRVGRKAIRDKIASAFGIFITDQGHPVLPVKLRFVPELARFVRSMLLHPGQEFCDQANGCLDISFPSTLNRELIGEILSFGEQVEVLESEELRKEIAAILRKTAKLYDRPGDKDLLDRF